MKFIIIGGAKTGSNLYNFFTRNKIPAEIYFLPDEFLAKKGIGKSFQKFKSEIDFHNPNLIITSESSFNVIPDSERGKFSIHYWLRDKENIPTISKGIGTSYIWNINDLNSCSFPVILKPKESNPKLNPFKFKIIYTAKDLLDNNNYISDCFIQPYLSKYSYRQVSVGGFFDGASNSLVAVKQISQYPVGVSAFIENITEEFNTRIEIISNYLNSLNFRGFIELEFKQDLKSKELFLMDINPRPWGWVNYYLDGMENSYDVFVNKEPAKINPKKAWINSPRMLMAMFKGNFSIPSLQWLMTNKISFEPYFKRL